jgi:hypothetical protein
MRCSTILPAAVAIVGLVFCPCAQAQYRVGPVYPEKGNQVASPGQAQSGYDPFQLNWRTGRYEYVPIPYENEPGGAESGYNPFKFNWHSGQWDYVPVAPVQPAYGRIEREPVTGGNFVDTRINPQAIDNGASHGGEAQTARAIAPSEPQASPPEPIKPSTQPSTAPVRPADHSQPGPPPKMRFKLAGHWEYNYDTGKWVFVLPPS